MLPGRPRNKPARNRLVRVPAWNTIASDLVPQARVITTWPATRIYVVNPMSNVLEQFDGAYTLAAIGTMPASAIGGVYTLTAVVNLSDTRILQVSARVLCVVRRT